MAMFSTSKLWLHRLSEARAAPGAARAKSAATPARHAIFLGLPLSSFIER